MIYSSILEAAHPQSLWHGYFLLGASQGASVPASQPASGGYQQSLVCLGTVPVCVQVIWPHSPVPGHLWVQVCFMSLISKTCVVNFEKWKKANWPVKSILTHGKKHLGTHTFDEQSVVLVTPVG